MNLLPKSHEEFAQADYWNSFFKKRAEKAFEWYGEYLDLCDQIHKYIKPTDKVLNVGCGNSKLTMDMYDSGFKDITNIDISEIAIKKMLDINGQSRPNMKFLQMDATKMSFEKETFSVALDKGTLDALFINESLDVIATVEKYLNEISRVMRNGGRYMAISLLQPHILRYILEYFPRNSFMLRIVHSLSSQHGSHTGSEPNSEVVSMPVFVIIATKFKTLPMPILEYSSDGDKMQRLENKEEMGNCIVSVQNAAMVCNGLSRNSIAGHNEVKLELCKPGETTPRFTIYVLDQPPARGLGKYAAFIVPQGREVEWLFATPQGRKKLQESARFQRLAIISMHRDQTYESLQKVQTELTDSVRNLAPLGLKEQIPYLSIGNDVGKRETLVNGFSKISGDFRIEEINGKDGKIFRRLIFLNNPNVIQSEALVKIIKTKAKKELRKIDVGYVACQHHLFMSAGVQMAIQISARPKELKNVLVIGLGGGGLCSFMHDAFQDNVRVTAVEIDPIMLEVAEQYFELRQDKHLHVVIDDGVAFVNQCKLEGFHFDAVLFDVDSKDLSLGMSCPPQSFLETTVLQNIKDIIGPRGVFILNLVCRDEELRKKTVADLKSIFISVCCYKLEEDINEVIYCCNEANYTNIDQWKRHLGSSSRNLNNLAKEHKLVNDDMVDVTNFIKKLEL